MVAKRANGRAGEAAVMAATKARGSRRKPEAKAVAAAQKSIVARRRGKADDFTDVMQTLDRVSVKNDELTDRINRLVTRLQ